MTYRLIYCLFFSILFFNFVYFPFLYLYQFFSSLPMTTYIITFLMFLHDISLLTSNVRKSIRIFFRIRH
uniref:7TM_GPCR_Srx domain-containing protein n=1 Tax=Heterorhabditis bacteriophora TaxID=37862 RepID=A0A1I7W629_HETBA